MVDVLQHGQCSAAWSMHCGIADVLQHGLCTVARSMYCSMVDVLWHGRCTAAWWMHRSALGVRSSSNASTCDIPSGVASVERASPSLFAHIHGLMRQPSVAAPLSSVRLEEHGPLKSLEGPKPPQSHFAKPLGSQDVDPTPERTGTAKPYWVPQGDRSPYGSRSASGGTEGNRRPDAVQTVSAVLGELSSRMTSLTSEDSDLASGSLGGAEQLETKVEDIHSFVVSRKESILEMMKAEEEGGVAATCVRLAELAQSYAQLENMLKTGSLDPPFGSGLSADRGEKGGDSPPLKARV